MRFLLPIFFTVATNSAFAATNEDAASCRQKFERWKTAYLAGSPVSAYNKVSERKVSLEDVQRAREDVTHIQVKEEFSIITGGFIDFYAGKKMDSTTSYINLTRLKSRDTAEKERDSAIVRSIADLVAQSSDETLVLIMTGQFHALDFFFNGKSEAKVNYGLTALRADSRLYSQAIYDINKVFEDMDAPEPHIIGMEVELYPLLRGIHLFHDQFSYLLSYVQQSRNRDPSTYFNLAAHERANSFIIGDLHTVNETAHIREMPSFPCWKLLGYKKIIVGLEGVNTNADKDRSREFLRSQIYSAVEPAHLREFRLKHPKEFSHIDISQVRRQPSISYLAEALLPLLDKDPVIEVRGIDKNNDGRRTEIGF